MGQGYLKGQGSPDISLGLTANAADIASGKTAAVNSEIITGTAIKYATGTFTIATQTYYQQVTGIPFTPTSVILMRINLDSTYCHAMGKSNGVSFSAPSGVQVTEWADRITFGSGSFTINTSMTGEFLLKGTYRWIATNGF